ncbi:uncharacterized protein BDZ83DRAFT_619962 [Colletotrichum acutatum]|uniref:Uncharacterized protein n=1 Tax=Glomerella acutata TaxID=27357 RepID=A0AAD8UK23_GLOAC|nr:uncharacterized protein BDZ83DRAFT_619962 [Colletotrichum acutatum]KAK1725361.1 hypothetical protein BDZ83DRAFT_619962 [Colletotrichum acutatum]
MYAPYAPYASFLALFTLGAHSVSTRYLKVKEVSDQWLFRRFRIIGFHLATAVPVRSHYPLASFGIVIVELHRACSECRGRERSL